MSNPKGHKIGRHAGSGRFMRVDKARKDPKHTTVEIIPNPPHKKNR
ncbi:MAG: hypothetical protein MUP47_05400 [Phycisphaerae bacterium]|nr:hypothetical protein [Phycisphaerae bacterium]